MDLLLWRHAEAEERTPDHKRRLTERGERQARQMAGWLKEHGPRHLRVVASPALRCQQTAAALHLPYDTDPRLGISASLPDLFAAVGWPGGGDDDEDDSGGSLRDSLEERRSPSAREKSPGERDSREKESRDRRRKRALLIVGHQPTLGRLAALILSGREADWTVQKGAVWWFSQRARRGETQMVLRAVVGPEQFG